MLRLTTFGGLSVHSGNGSLAGAASQRRALALLAVLAAAGERGVSRDKLLAYFWPESDTESGRHALSQALYALRRDLKEDSLVARSHELRLSRDRITADVMEFNDALDAGELDRAAALYAGPFLDGFYLSGAPEFERWADEERARLARRAADALQTVAKRATARGDPAAAEWWHRLAALDPLDSRAALGLMNALASSGQRAEALQRARTHQEMLRRELDAAPDATVDALAERLRDESPPVDASAVGWTAAADVAVIAPNTIAVIDFANLARDPSLEWLSGAIADTVTVDLKKIRRLRIVGRDKVMQASAGRSSPTVDVASALEVGRTVGARWVIWGGFQRVGRSLRITPQYAETTAGGLAGADKIDGPMDDVLALQDRIVTGLMDLLEVQLSDPEIAHIARRETDQLAAYEHYAKGRRLFMEFGKAGFQRAAEHFRQAVAVDPSYALAHCGLGSIFALQYIERATQENLESATASLLRAAELDPDLAEAHGWLAHVYIRQERFEEAEQAALRAVAVEPDGMVGHYFLGLARHFDALTTRRWDRAPSAVAAYARAIELEPGVQIAYLTLAALYTLNGQYAAARPLLDAAVRIEGSTRFKGAKFVGALSQRATLHFREGEVEAATRMLRDALERYGASDHVYAKVVTAATLCQLGDAAYAREAFDESVEWYTRACELCERHPEGVGIGYFLIRGRLGRAKAFNSLRMRREESAELAAATKLLTSKEGYIFSWVYDGGDAGAYYDLASYYAAAGRKAEALTALDTAIDYGWGELPRLATDEGFAQYAGDPRLRALRARVTARGDLPAFDIGRIAAPA